MEDFFPDDGIIVKLFTMLTWVIPVAFSIIPHEIAHGYAALLMGDTTAKDEGRLSFNPLKHVDWYGTVILPLFLMISRIGIVFGYAKPVPVDFSKMKNIRKGLIVVAAAGPAANFVLAAVFVFFLYLLNMHKDENNLLWLFLYASFIRAVLVNLCLGVFNLIPLPPLDGGKILIGILPPEMGKKVAAWDGRKGLTLLFVLLILPAFFGEDCDVIGMIVNTIVKAILSLPFLVGLQI